MAGGKETPRQKMIGMMYLVLTALLAMNVSKDILNAFVIINEGLQVTNENFMAKNEFTYAQFEKAKANDPEKVAEFYNKAMRAKGLSDEIYLHIEELKKYLTAVTAGKASIEEVEDDSLFDLRNVESKDNYDIPTLWLVGSEPQAPKEGEWSALELKGKIENFKSELLYLFDNEEERQALQLGLATEGDFGKEDGVPQTWVTANFYHLPLAAVVTNLSKIQADNQVRFQDIEVAINSSEDTSQLSLKPKSDVNEVLPGSSQPQDLGSISYKDTETSETSQQIQSVDTTASVVTENFQAEEKILPQDLTPKKQYEFATSFLKVGDYSTAERAFREFVITNSEHELAGSAQYWYAETFRIRQLYTDAASAYLEGYQKYPKGKKAPINLLKLGVSMVQIGEKDQGCKMINGVEVQYPNANQSIIQKAKYESKKFECIKQDS